LREFWHGTGVFGDKGFIGTGYITTPIRKPEGRELYIRQHDYNNQISSHRTPVERAVASLKTWRFYSPITGAR
jgi:DDE superfamily endonuclease